MATTTMGDWYGLRAEARGNWRKVVNDIKLTNARSEHKQCTNALISNLGNEFTRALGLVRC